MEEIALASAFGAAFGQPGRTITCVVRDEVAESGATAAAWASIRYLDPERDGAIAVVLELTGDTWLARLGEDELTQLLRGLGWRPRFDDGPPAAGEVLITRGASGIEPTAYDAPAVVPELPDPASFDTLDAYLAAAPVRVIAPGPRDEAVLQGWLHGHVRSGRAGLYVGARVTRPLTAGTYLLRELPPLPDAPDARMLMPPDVPTLLEALDRSLRSPAVPTAIVAPADLPAARLAPASEKSANIWSDCDGEPDIVLAACGAHATRELLAATELLREQVPELRVRLVNVIDLFALATQSAHATGLSQAQFARRFTRERPVLFAVDGPAATVHQLIHRRPQGTRFHVLGAGANRYELAIEALNRADLLAAEMLPGMSGEFAMRAVPNAEAAIHRFRAALSERGAEV